MKKNRNKKGKLGDIFHLSWSDLPFWLQWGILGGIFGLVIVISIYIGMSFNYLLITKTMVREGLIASLIAFSAGFLHATIFSIIMYRNWESKQRKKPRKLAYSNQT